MTKLVKQFAAVALILAFALLFVSLVTGCKSAPPIFQPDARPLNRIASGYEVLTELNGEVAELVSAGILTQAKVDERIGPALDKSRAILESAEALYRAGKQEEGAPKLQQFADGVRLIREYLATLKGRK